MGKKNEHPILKEMFPVTLDHLDKKKLTGKPSIDNVHDDEIWGKEWNRARYAAAKELKDRKEREGAEHDAYEKAQKARADRKQARIDANPAGPFEWSRFSTAGKKYHIGPDGKARPCRAEIRSCPYGTGDHFGVEDNIRADPQKIANWIVERRSNATATTTALTADSSAVADPRNLSRQARAAAEERGARANIIELEATIDLAFARQPVKISRKIGNTIDNRWADHAYYVLDDGVHEPTITDSVSEADLSNFVLHYLDYAAQQEDEGVRQEIAEELKAKIREIMQVAEGEAALAQEGSAHYSTVQLELDGELVFEDNTVQATINYGTSGFDPLHLKAAAERAGKNITNVHIAEGFEVFDGEAGEGTASWKMVKARDGWEVTVQGTRGDVTLFQVQTPEEAEERFREALTARVRAQDPNKARYFGENLTSEQVDAKSRVDERARFAADLLVQEAKMASGKPASVQEDLFAPEQGDESSGGFFSLFK